jgi:hypothetical protein
LSIVRVLPAITILVIVVPLEIIDDGGTGGREG